jgi:NAD-dependent epimerase/dehydratase
VEVSNNSRLGDIRHNYADFSKARRLLSFTPCWPFERGITESTRWVDGQQVQADHDKASIEERKLKVQY